MRPSDTILDSTGIVEAVGGLCHHEDTLVRRLAEALSKEWKRTRALGGALPAENQEDASGPQALSLTNSGAPGAVGHPSVQLGSPQQPAPPFAAEGEVEAAIAIHRRTRDTQVAIVNEESQKAEADVRSFEELFTWMQQFANIDAVSLRALQGNLSGLREHIRRFSEELNKLIQANYDLRIAIIQKESDVRRAESDLAGLRGLAYVDRQQLEEKTCELSQCRQLLQAAKGELERKEQEIVRLTSESQKAGDIKPNAAEVPQYFQPLGEAVVRGKAEQMLRDQLAGVQKQFHSACVQLRNAREKATSQESTISDLQAELSNLQSAMTTQANDMARQAQEAQAKMRTLESQLMWAQEDLQNQRTIDDLRSEARSREVDLENRKNEIVKLKQKLRQRTTRDPNTLRSADEEMQAENIRLSDELYELQQQLQAKDRELEDVKKQKEEALKGNPRRSEIALSEPVIVRTGEGTTADEHIDILIQQCRAELTIAEKQLEDTKGSRAEVSVELTRLKPEWDKLNQSRMERGRQRRQDGGSEGASNPPQPAEGEAPPTQTPISSLPASDAPPASGLSPPVASESIPSTPAPLSLTDTAHPPSTTTNNESSYAAAVKKPAVQHVGVLKITAPAQPVKKGNTQRAADGSLLTGHESAQHGKGKKAFETLARKEKERHNATRK
ncbi:hypothetical protein BU26DRAFT_502467 [Trematosphaeria pertusa]|uniref:TFIIS N-terminal domain-containing protein n=1 Tax=Trematosphaeria pertusa TaxID=390896 RepID=A0A6A6IQN9_9PLEO|nr:uncharacterized protein BU26DRAFT_502467 [Trematosphaeria pertusa]KAF2251890.1 hypothetical protein BU26DRAFT_502467 [Trematosphaeria pertusa]